MNILGGPYLFSYYLFVLGHVDIKDVHVPVFAHACEHICTFVSQKLT